MRQTKHFFSAIAFFAAMSLISCNKIELPVEDPGSGLQETQEPSAGWTVAINATIGAGTKALAEDPDTHMLLATFETTDAIYVYNKTKNKMDANPLYPDQDGASAVLTGTLAESYDAGDELVLCYNSNNSGLFRYEGQKGTLSTVADNAAVMESGIIIKRQNKTRNSIRKDKEHYPLGWCFSFYNYRTL